MICRGEDALSNISREKKMNSIEQRTAQQKVEWTSPNLIIIGRGRPEESVLKGCKSRAQPNGTLATATNTNCNKIDGSCGACQSNGGGVS